MNNETNSLLSPRLRRLFLIAAVPITLIGVTLRIYPSAKYTRLGFDEGLYGEYVVELVKQGVTSYPDLAELYVERQQAEATVFLPPTRFLYIFSGYLWHQVTGANAIASLRAISCLFSILLLFAAAGFA